MAFAVGFLSTLIVLNFLSVTMPDYQDNFGYTFWWIPVAFLLILFIPLFLIRNFILRFSFYQGMVDIASKLGAVFSAAALGVTAYLSIGFILYYNLIGLLYISTAVFSFGTLAFINGKALGNIKPLPIWYAVISAFLFPLFGLLMVILLFLLWVLLPCWQYRTALPKERKKRISRKSPRHSSMRIS
jgi:hypothetical protein